MLFTHFANLDKMVKQYAETEKKKQYKTSKRKQAGYFLSCLEDLNLTLS